MSDQLEQNSSDHDTSIQVPVVTVSLNALDLANDESKRYDEASEATQEPEKSPKDLMTKSFNALLETEHADNLVQDDNNKDIPIESESIPNTYEGDEINRLKDLLSQKESEIQSLEAKLTDQEQQSKQQIEQLHQNFTQKLEQTLKKFQEMQKDKTSSMVMKYAEAEKKNIDLHRSNELLQSKLNDASKEKLRLIERLDKSKQEIDRLNADNDKKLNEMLALRKEYERIREQSVLNDAKDNAAQIKLKNEIEAHLNTRKQLEVVNQELSEWRRRKQLGDSSSDIAVESAASDTESKPVTESKGDDESIKSEIKSSSNSNLTVTTSTVKTTPPDRDKTVRELYALKSQLKDMFEERSTLRDKLQCMEQERKLQEISLSKYKETLQSQKQMNKELLNEILQLRELQETVAKEKSEKTDLEKRLATATSELNDLQVELKVNQEKQNELLSFTSKLTEKNTQLQSEKLMLEEKLLVAQTELDRVNSALNQSNEAIKTQVSTLMQQLDEKSKQIELLSNQVTEKTKEIQDLTTKLEDERDENTSLKKKHAANVKDLTRQLHLLQKKTSNSNSTSSTHQQQSQHQQHNHSASNSLNSSLLSATTSTPQGLTSSASEHSIVNRTHSTLSQTPVCLEPKRASRTSSSSSLNNTDSQNQFQYTSISSLSKNRAGSISYDDDGRASLDSANLTPGIVNYGNEVIVGAPSHQHHQDDVYVVDIDKQKLIEKIVKLQREMAKRNEKIDFLQDHVNQLTGDLKKKTKIIQAYAIKEDVGAFTSEAQDAIKREMAKKTGIMSALYNTNKSYLQTAQLIAANESNMTKELCLEINAKLQALLEDTLIKNLTLKDNIETLGQEIARLSKENRQIKLADHG